MTLCQIQSGDPNKTFNSLLTNPILKQPSIYNNSIMQQVQPMLPTWNLSRAAYLCWASSASSRSAAVGESLSSNSRSASSCQRKTVIKLVLDFTVSGIMKQKPCANTTKSILGETSKCIISGCSQNAAAPHSYVGFSYINWLQQAAEYGGCSQLILTSPLTMRI